MGIREMIHIRLFVCFENAFFTSSVEGVVGVWDIQDGILLQQ